MKLAHIAMVGWHMFDIEDIAVEGDIGILGENRSGKSTILDLLQVILTGASSSFYRLNSTAGDNGGLKSKSRRTVHGYCLGVLGEGDPKRDSSLTYVSMSFKDPEGSRPPLTIGLALQASRAETVEVALGRFVVMGEVLTTDDFLEKRDGGLFPIAWDDFRVAMTARLGTDGFINHRERPIDFVREYMRRLVPSMPAGEKHAAAMLKAIVNAMTLPTGLSATEFVRNFIIPDHPIRIADLRNSIETYRSVDRAIAEMKQRLAELKVIREHIAAFSLATDQETLETWTVKRARWLSSLTRHRELKRIIAATEERLKVRDEDVEDVRRRIEEIEFVISNTLALLAAKRAGSGLDAKEKLSVSLERRVGEIETAIQKRLGLAKRLETLSSVPGIDPADLTRVRRFSQAVTKLRESDGPAELIAAEAALLATEQLEQRLEDKRNQTQEQLAVARKRLGELRALVGDDPSRRPADSHLEMPTRKLMLALRQANMAPRPLCDLIEVTDSSWSAAVEGLLGRDRETVLVDRADISRATAIFKANRRDFRGASLVSLNKLKETGEQPRAGFLPSIIRTDDRDAMLFILRRHGTVRLAYDMVQFEQDGRALMQDGLYDDGLARNHRAVDPSEFKIGRSAQASLAQRRQAELQDLTEAFVADATLNKALVETGTALAQLRADDSNFAVLFEMAGQAISEQEVTQGEIDAIKARGDDGLGDKLRANRALKDRALEEKKALEEELAEDRGTLKSSQQMLNGLQNVPGSFMHLALAKRFYREHRRVHHLAKGIGRFDYQTRYGRALGDRTEGSAYGKAHLDIADAAATALERATNRRVDANEMARRALRAYFDKFGPSSQVGAESALILEVKPWMDINIDDIENNALREREREASEAAAKARSLFRSEFINELTSRITNMEWELRTLNASMANHPFHNERYSFHKTQDAVYGPILRVIDIAKASDDALDMLFREDIPADFEYAETIAEVTRLLEDPDIDFSSFEDYRRFYTFDLHMEDIVFGRKERWEARRLTGSGAEQQVPLYVAIAASLSSVYGRKSGKGSGIALAMFDEAFTKLDGKNQRQMISFFKSLGLQIVIVAPPEKRSIVTGYIDTIVEVDRVDDDASTEVVYLKERVRREIAAINPDNLSDEQVRHLLAAE
jgi:uncharacterized protein YPO0396